MRGAARVRHRALNAVRNCRGGQSGLAPAWRYGCDISATHARQSTTLSRVTLSYPPIPCHKQPALFDQAGNWECFVLPLSGLDYFRLPDLQAPHRPLILLRGLTPKHPLSSRPSTTGAASIWVSTAAAHRATAAC